MSNLIKVHSLAVYGNFLYWVDSGSGELKRVNKMTGHDQQLIQGGIKEPVDVMIVDKYSFDGKFVETR